MSENSYRTIKLLLSSTAPDELRQGLGLAKKEIARVGSSEARPLFEMISAIFYIDPYDHPELAPILDEAVSLVVGFGEWVIPMLIEKLDAGDLKAQWAVANALGRIGADAIKPLMLEYASTTDLTRRAFILYTLGKVKSPKILQAASLALDAAQSSDRELRDTATRALGKFVESIPPEDLSNDLRRRIRECLHNNLSDPSASVRAKAIRSLGKLAKYGHLTAPERAQLQVVCQRALGTDEQTEWDRAYIVRKEAEEALRYV
ncbi:MAG: HEAT repeat domain-containing protein [Chloroflexota bacterium]